MVTEHVRLWFISHDLFLQLDKKLGDQIILADFGGFSCNWRLFWSPILLVQLYFYCNVSTQIVPQE